jgi:hypothetical protein
MFNFYDTDTKEYQEILTAQEASKKIYDTVQFYATRVKKLDKANQELRDKAVEIVKHQYEEEIAALKERLHLSYGEFASQKELDAYNDFTDRHMHDRLTSKYNGGRVPYLIPTGTGIGTILKVVCPICGESEDITDTGAW